MTQNQYDILLAMVTAPEISFIPFRRGQAIFNKAHEFNPDLNVPNEADCFYDDSKIGQFLNCVYSDVQHGNES
jgi:hypothetical protein